MKEILHCARKSRSIDSWSLVAAILIVQLTVTLGHTILEEYSCGQDDIEYGVTLRDGINAGIFRDRGPVKNMQECMHLCCTSKNCDVAMMHGPKCFSVRCLNDSACESIPADDDDIDMQIAHMTTKGTGQFTKAPLNDTADQYDPDSKCPHNEIMYNVKLKAGLKAGKFTDIGKVKSINTCIRYCCESTQPCDLAFMLSDRCYLVKCYSEERCQALPAPSVDYSFHQKMAFVAPWLYQKGKKVVKIPSGQSPHHLQCIQSKRYTNSRLLDGQNAGDFTDVGRVTKPHICTRLCCEEPSCDLAYMFGRTCFLVRCRSERSCRVIPDDEARLNDKPTFDRSIQYIIKRKFGVKLRDDGTPVLMTKTGLEESCQLDGEIRNKTVLMAGMLSGQLTHHKGVGDITSCIKQCCARDKCHVAMMMAGKCYSVFCTDKQYCQPKPAPQETHHTNPTVAYVKRGEISLAPKPDPIIPLIERFHPNIEQAVEEMYLEEEEKDSDPEKVSEVDKNIDASWDNKTADEQTEGSAVGKDRNDLKGSGVNEEEDTEPGYNEEKQSDDKASGESGQEDSGESEESGKDIDDSGDDEVEQQSMSLEHQGTS